jgi:hypothetical protein
MRIAVVPRWSIAECSAFAHPPPVADGRMIVERSYGWPLSVLTLRSVVTLSKGLVLHHSVAAHLRGGLFVNTILFAPFIVVLWAATLRLERVRAAARLRALRRQRRKARMCPICGYDLRGRAAPGCSECGWGRSSGLRPVAGRPDAPSGVGRQSS